MIVNFEPIFFLIILKATLKALAIEVVENPV
jgi:hypothetical protein